jgi:hypothetical protein
MASEQVVGGVTMAPATIFFDFNLPNATTWFYFSWLLAVALFFKFSRFLSVRNWDVLALFLLVPGLLLLQEAHFVHSEKRLWFGYLWLLGGSAYFFGRCLFDLTLIRRPALGPNLNFGGLAWLGGALFVCLVSVALRQPHGPAEPSAVGKIPSAVVVAKEIEGQVTPRLTGDADAFDNPWIIPTLALLCHLAVVAGLVVVGWLHFHNAHAGMAAATFYLLLPYTAVHIGQVHHVWPAALLVWAVAAYRLPLLAGLLLGLAAGSVYFPALVLPVWLSFYWRRGVGRFAAAFVLSAGITLAVMATVLWLRGDLAASLRSALELSDWQPWKKPETEGFWLWIDGTSIHWAYRLPMFIAYLSFLALTAVWPTPKNLANVIALSAALLIGVQFWYADQGGMYVLWYLPLLLLLAFRPNLSDRLPPAIYPEKDWLTQGLRALGRLGIRLLRLPEPVARVH